jgi:serine/threonine-protein kinase
MSPEQARGEKVDARVDVYAAGCLLWEMLFGDVPFTGDNFMGILTKHLFDPVPRLPDASVRPDLPDGLQAVIDKALAKNRDDRYPSMRALAAALDALDAGRAPSEADEEAIPVGPVGDALAEVRRGTDLVEGTVPPGPRRRRTLFLAGAAAAVAIVGGFGVVMFAGSAVKPVVKAPVAPAAEAAPVPAPLLPPPVVREPEPEAPAPTPAPATASAAPAEKDAGIEDKPRRRKTPEKKAVAVKKEPVAEKAVEKAVERKPVDPPKKPPADIKLKEIKDPFGG